MHISCLDWIWLRKHYIYIYILLQAPSFLKSSPLVIPLCTVLEFIWSFCSLIPRKAFLVSVSIWSLINSIGTALFSFRNDFHQPRQIMPFFKFRLHIHVLVRATINHRPQFKVNSKLNLFLCSPFQPQEGIWNSMSALYSSDLKPPSRAATALCLWTWTRCGFFS